MARLVQSSHFIVVNRPNYKQAGDVCRAYTPEYQLQQMRQCSLVLQGSPHFSRRFSKLAEPNLVTQQPHAATNGTGTVLGTCGAMCHAAG